MCMYVCVYICKHACIYVCTHTYTHTYTLTHTYIRIFQAYIYAYSTTGIGGIFIARARDSRLNSLQDIRGKVVVAELAGVGFLEGCLLQWREMMRQGMFLTEDPAAVIWNTEGQVVSVKLVEQGLADVAFLRTSMLELLEYQKRINVSDFKILGSRTALWRGALFPAVTSTEISAEWAVNVVQGTDRGVINKLWSALLELRAPNASMSSAFIHRFRSPEPYWKMRSVIEDLGMLHVDPVTQKRYCNSAELNFDGDFHAYVCECMCLRVYSV